MLRPSRSGLLILQRMAADKFKQIFLISWRALALHAGIPPAFGDDSSTELAKHADFFDLLFYDPADLSIRYVKKPRSHIDGQATGSELSETTLNVEFAFPTSADSAAFLDATFDKNSFEFGTLPGADEEDISSTAESLELGTGFAKFLTPDFIFAGIFYPSVRSDLSKSINSNDFELMTGPLLV